MEWRVPRWAESKEVVLECKGRGANCLPHLESKLQLLMEGHHKRTFRRLFGCLYKREGVLVRSLLKCNYDLSCYLQDFYLFSAISLASCHWLVGETYHRTRPSDLRTLSLWL